MTRYFLGIDIGGTKCAVCLGDESGKIVDKEGFPTKEPEGPGQAIDNFLRIS